MSQKMIGSAFLPARNREGPSPMGQTIRDSPVNSAFVHVRGPQIRKRVVG